MGKGDRAAWMFESVGLGALLRRLRTWRGVLVLNHHRVGDATRWITSHDVWSATAEQLDEQARFLVRNFDVVSPEDLGRGVQSRAGRHVAITFDDGYRECYDVALPILRSYGIRAAFFVVTGFIDATRAAWWDEITWMVGRSDRALIPANGWLRRPISLEGRARETGLTALAARYKSLDGASAASFMDFLAEATGSGRRDPSDARADWITWDMAREMRRQGMVLGGHTVNHPVLARQPPDVQRTEIAGCLDRMQEELGERPQLFSYPDGMPGTFDTTTKTLMSQEGVRLAFTNYGRVIAGSARRWDRLALPRFSLGTATTEQRVRAATTLPQVFIRD